MSDDNVQPEVAWPSQGKVSFNQISLRYRPTTDLVLKNISFDIEPGMKVGIVGRTGSGKSTIAMTLSRILELESGSIQIDGINIRDLSLHNLRSKVTMIPQDPCLFKGTLKYNIDPTGQVPDSTIEALVEKAGLPDLLKSFDSEKNILDYEV